MCVGNTLPDANIVAHVFVHTIGFDFAYVLCRKPKGDISFRNRNQKLTDERAMLVYPWSARD